jgi:hypothetical protein
MAFVKGFDINGINTTQTACIELQGRPNAATEGAVGLLGIDVTSPTKDVYKCVAVNGAVYTWELLSTGMSILASNNTTSGTSKRVLFPHDQVQTPDNYVVKVGDLIIDATGYIYRVIEIERAHYLTEYTGVHVNRDGVGINSVEQKDISDENGYNIATRVTIKLTNGNTYSFDVKNAYQLAVAKGYKGTEEEWLDNIGYDSWLKGMAVTQETYDALSEEEKNKPGYMYVIKDADIEVDSADTLKLERVDEHTFTEGDNEWSVSLTKGGVYMVNVEYTYGEIPNAPFNNVHTTGMFYANPHHNTKYYSNFGYHLNTTVYCKVECTNTSNGMWKFGLFARNTSNEESSAPGRITLYKIK